MLDFSAFRDKREDPSGRVAIVTGATGGIGQVVALELASAGMAVCLAYHTRKAAAAALASAIRAEGGEALAIMADVSDEAQVQDLVERTVGAFGRLDILINNAGINRDGMCWKMPLEVWQQVLEVNLTGAFLCTKHAAPIMRSQKWGRIINISSVVAQMGVPGTAAYSAAKAGLIGLTKTTARELARYGVTVNCLALGYFNTGMMLDLPESLRDQIVSQIPMSRLGDPHEVAHAVRFLCDDKASYITGQVIAINGGLFM